jgi:hypothetical protein
MSTTLLARETFAVAVESKECQDHDQVRRIQRQVAHAVVAEVDVRPRNVAVLQPGMIPKTRRESCGAPTPCRSSPNRRGSSSGGVDLSFTMAD